jgi:hypothetical protein
MRDQVGRSAVIPGRHSDLFPLLAEKPIPFGSAYHIPPLKSLGCSPKTFALACWLLELLELQTKKRGIGDMSCRNWITFAFRGRASNTTLPESDATGRLVGRDASGFVL